MHDVRVAVPLSHALQDPCSELDCEIVARLDASAFVETPSQMI